MTEFFRDVRLGARTLAKSPGFAATAVVTLALGIGATTAMFTVVDGVLLKPLGYRDADRIVAVSTVFTNQGRAIPRVTGGDFVDIRAEHSAFESIASYYGGEMGVQVAGRAEFVGAILVGTEFTTVFGVPPIAGRLFNADDVQQSAMVGAGFAVRNFGSAGRAIGRLTLWQVEQNSAERWNGFRKTFLWKSGLALTTWLLSHCSRGLALEAKG